MRLARGLGLGLTLLRPFYTSAAGGPSGLLRVNHALLAQAVRRGDTAIDCTCGNGFDSLILSRLVLPTGELHCIDLQKSAIDSTRLRLEQEFGKELVEKRVKLYQCTHATLPHLAKGSVAAIVYNLGYLPGSNSDKSVTTDVDSTLQSLQQAFSEGLLRPNGILTIMTYPHNGQEESKVPELLSGLSIQYWDVSTHKGLLGSGKGPTLYSARRRS